MDNPFTGKIAGIPKPFLIVGVGGAIGIIIVIRRRNAAQTSGDTTAQDNTQTPTDSSGYNASSNDPYAGIAGYPGMGGYFPYQDGMGSGGPPITVNPVINITVPGGPKIPPIVVGECPAGHHKVGTKCVPNTPTHTCKKGYHYDLHAKKCVKNKSKHPPVHRCPPHHHWDARKKKCIPGANHLSGIDGARSVYEPQPVGALPTAPDVRTITGGGLSGRDAGMHLL